MEGINMSVNTLIHTCTAQKKSGQETIYVVIAT